MISLIAAVDSDGGIGKDGKIPWKCPEDMRFFKTMTQKKMCMIGKSTYENLPDVAKLNRSWVRFTHDPFSPFESELNEEVFNNFKLVINDEFVDPSFQSYSNSFEVMLCGGAKIYKEFLDRDFIDRMYITKIPGYYDCDTFFPSYDESKFKLSYHIVLSADKFLEDDIIVNVYDRI